MIVVLIAVIGFVVIVVGLEQWKSNTSVFLLLAKCRNVC